MRSISIFSVCLALAPACSHRNATDPGDAGGSGVDASMQVDSGRVRDTGIAMPDTSSGHDVGLADGGATDGGSVVHDGGSAPDATTIMHCAGAVDVSAGGTFMIDTCASTDQFTSPCGGTGALDVIVSATEASTTSTHIDIADGGWVIQQLTSTCAPSIGGTSECTTLGSWGVSGADGTPRWYFGIEKADGTCGMVTITVTRTT
jgi:hypothetical protein